MRTILWEICFHMTHAQFASSGHRKCLDMSPKLWKRCKAQRQWLCIECKICMVCNSKGDEERMLLCDVCDGGVHMDCLSPVRILPSHLHKASCECSRKVSWSPPSPPISRHPIYLTSPGNIGRAVADIIINWPNILNQNFSCSMESFHGHILCIMIS